MERKENPQSFILLLIRYWIIYVLSFCLFLLLGYLYIRTTDPVYLIKSRILVTETKYNGDVSKSEILEDYSMNGTPPSVENIVYKLSSINLLDSVVKKLQLNVKYKTASFINNKQIQQSQIPLFVSFTESEKDFFQTQNIAVSAIDNNSCFFSYNKNKRTVVYGDTIKFNFGKFFITKKEIKSNFEPFSIQIEHPSQTATALGKNLTLLPTSKIAGTIDLSLLYYDTEEGEKVLSTFLSVYNENQIKIKNRIADSNISNIDKRLLSVSLALLKVESDLKGFREVQDVTDISAQGKTLYDNVIENSKLISETEMQINVIKNLESFLSKPEIKSIPSSMLFRDENLQKMIGTYNDLQIGYAEKVQTTGSDNPILKNIESQIITIRANILSYLGSTKSSLLINLASIQSNSGNLENKIQELPGNEKTSASFSRLQEIKEELYLYLLKKKEAAEINKITENNEFTVIDQPTGLRKPLQPKPLIVLLAACTLSIFLPTSILLLKNYFNKRIRNLDFLTAISTYPIAGELGRNNTKSKLIQVNTKHPLTEQFRKLAINLRLTSKKNLSDCRTLLVTSSMRGEGKSFVSANLARLLASYGYKTVLLDFDLRKPTINKYFSQLNEQGIWEILNGYEKVESYLQNFDENPNLSILTTGNLSDNPSLLINNEATAELFKELRKIFTFIIVDSPPVGVVSDALLLAQECDMVLYVVRENYTFSTQVENVQNIIPKEDQMKVFFVLNAATISKKNGYGYGYE